MVPSLLPLSVALKFSANPGGGKRRMANGFFAEGLFNLITAVEQRRNKDTKADYSRYLTVFLLSTPSPGR
jgi:hypothetical protein